MAYGSAAEPAGTGAEETEAAATTAIRPDLSSCTPVESKGSSEIARDGPLAIPKSLSGLVASDFDHVAVSTLAGGTVCVDSNWIANTSDMELSSDGRFVSFEWYGYEVYGFVLVDRSGAGAVVETGVKPVRSPSGRLAAAVEYSESGFGSLNALGIWDISATPVREVAIVQFPEGQTDWRFDGWTGEECIGLSATTFEQFGEDGAGPQEAARDRFVARADGGWQVQPAGETGCPRP